MDQQDKKGSSGFGEYFTEEIELMGLKSTVRILDWHGTMR